MRIELEIQKPNKETLSPEFLDFLLYLTLKASKDESYVSRSIVSAGVYDQETNHFYVACARKVVCETDYGRWNHAEHEAMALAQEHEVDLSKAIVVTTLGPCIKAGNTREHVSCTDLLLGSGVKNVHIGVLDYNQADLDLYRKVGLPVTVSSDPMLTQTCAYLRSYFDSEQKERLLGVDKMGFIEEALKNVLEIWESGL